MNHQISPKKKPKQHVFQIKLGLAIAIIASAFLLKTFAGGPNSRVSNTIDRVVNGGVDYKEVVSTIGRAVNGEEDVIEVFRGFAIAPEKEVTEEDKKRKAEDSENEKEKISEPVIDLDFYKTTIETKEEKPVQKSDHEPKIPAILIPEEQIPPAIEVSQEQQELAEAERLSFEMSPEELADDTKPEPFRIPPPSYCSYEKVSIAFRHTTPVYGTITSKYGYRDHPIGGKASFHTGIDIAARSGTPVACFADGTVLQAAHNDTYGNYVLVEHSGGIRSFYGHNSKLVVKKGQKVKMGQKLAEVGTTGLSTGPHLHFEVRKGTMRLDPKYYISTERV